MAVDVRYRDKDGEISRKHGNTRFHEGRSHSYDRTYA
jgi:hypothetical protein